MLARRRGARCIGKIQNAIDVIASASRVRWHQRPLFIVAILAGHADSCHSTSFVEVSPLARAGGRKGSMLSVVTHGYFYAPPAHGWITTTRGILV